MKKVYLKKQFLIKSTEYVDQFLKVTYEREYYKYNNYRITFDKGLIYSKFQSKKEFGDNYSVIEFKGNFIDEDNLNVTFPYLDSRFSKYCRACDLIKEFRLDKNKFHTFVF